MKKFYIYNKKTQERTLLDVEISPSLAETLDESLDNMTIKVLYNRNKKPFKPRLHEVHLYEYDETNETETLIVKLMIAGDNVNLVGTNDDYYEHTVSLVQRSQDFTKNLIRNNVFSNRLFKGLNVTAGSTAQVVYYADSLGAGVLRNWALVSTSYTYTASPLVISIDLSKTKILKPKLRINFSVYRTTDAYSPGDFSPDPGYGNYRESHIYAVESKPRRYTDIYEDIAGIPDDLPLPPIKFEIDSEQPRYLELTSNEVLNGELFNLDESIFNWIKSHDSGTLKISIPNLDGFNTFFNDLPYQYKYINGTMKTPVLVSLTVDLLSDTVIKNVYSIIEDLLKQYQKNTKKYHDEPLLFKMPYYNDDNDYHNKELYELLTSTEAPNFVFTQSSMFDALAEIFKLFDATFRIDDDGYLDIEYFNEHRKIELPDQKKAGLISSLGEERFANRLVTYYQNTKMTDKFPNSNNEYASAYVRSKSLGIPSPSDYVFITPKPIDIVTKMFINYPKRDVGFYFIDNDPVATTHLTKIEIWAIWHLNPINPFLDVSENVVSDEIWSVLPTTGNLSEQTKRNCFAYKRGSRFIDVNGTYEDQYGIINTIATNVMLSGIAKSYGIGDIIYYPTISIDIITDVRTLLMKIEYIALVDGKLVNESIDNKYEGEILTNQNNGSIDINKLGLNMVGLSLKLGQPTLTMTQKFSNWADRVKKGEFFIDEETGDKWVANVCTYTLITNDIIQATIEFVKNFNGLASRIQLNHEKRLSLISDDLTVKCEDDYGEFVYYCDGIDPSVVSDLTEEIALKSDFVMNSLAMTVGRVLPERTVATIDANSRVINRDFTNINTPTNLYTLARISGYLLKSGNSSNPTSFILCSNSDLQTAPYFPVPSSASHQNAMRLNEITNCFEYNYDLVNAQTEFPIDANDGDEVQILLLIYGTTIVGCVFERNITTSHDYFNIEQMRVYMSENTDRVEYTLVTALNEDNTVIINNGVEVKNVAIPLVVYGAGNSVCFEMSFDSPINAGNQLVLDYTFYDDGWFSKAVLYANKNGEAAKFTIDFVKLQEQISRQFPSFRNDAGTGYLMTYSFGKLEEYGYYKKANEIFALNYQLHYLPYKPNGLNQSFLGNEFIKNNGFANGLNEKPLHFVYTKSDDVGEDANFEYSILDTKGYGSHVASIKQILTVPTTYTAGVNHIGLYFNTSINDMENPSGEYSKIKTWALVDEDNNIYYSSNNAPIGLVFNIVFFWRHHRLD